MNMDGHVFGSEPLIEGIPVLIAQGGRFAIAFAWIRIKQDADEAQFVNGAVKLIEDDLYRLASHLGQACHTPKARGMQCDSARDQIIVGGHPDLHIPYAGVRVHEHKGARRNQLHIGPNAVHHLHTAVSRRFDFLVRGGGTQSGMQPIRDLQERAIAKERFRRSCQNW